MSPNGALTTLVSLSTWRGETPYGLIQGKDGDLYGTASGSTSSNYGTIFKVSTSGVLTVLVSFNYQNGAYIFGPLLQGKDGKFYGITTGGGDYNGGSVFEMSPDGILTTMYWFSAPYAEGNQPYGDLIQGTDGNFYGTASLGGFGGTGTIFKIKPRQPQTITFPSPGIPKVGQTVQLNATASSGLPATYRVVSGPARINGDKVIFDAAGLAKLAASQPGDGTFLPAKEVLINVRVK